MEKQTLYRRNFTFRVRKIGNKNILFGDGQCYELNELALLIWNNLNGEKTLDDIVKIVMTNYDTKEEIIKKDISTFMDEMAKNNIFLMEA